MSGKRKEAGSSDTVCGTGGTGGRVGRGGGTDERQWAVDVQAELLRSQRAQEFAGEAGLRGLVPAACAAPCDAMLRELQRLMPHTVRVDREGGECQRLAYTPQALLGDERAVDGLRSEVLGGHARVAYLGLTLNELKQVADNRDCNAMVAAGKLLVIGNSVVAVREPSSCGGSVTPYMLATFHALVSEEERDVIQRVLEEHSRREHGLARGGSL